MISTKLFYSVATKEMIETDIDIQINSLGKQYKLEVALIKAFIYVESQFQPLALRFEPHLMRAKWYNKVIPEALRTNKYAYCSMGLMQVMYGIARDHGFRGKPMELLEPKHSLKFGVIHLKKLCKRMNLSDAISSYNQGSPRKGADGKYKNQYYVDKVLKAYKKFKKAS